MAVIRIAKAHTTKAPTGLSITRNGNVFVFSWKIADADYNDGQVLEWRVNDSKTMQSITVRKTDTSASVKLDFDQYMPATKKALNSIEFFICGRRKSWTQRVTKKGKTYDYVYQTIPSSFSHTRMDFKVPDDPAAGVSVQTGDVVNLCTFVASENNPAGGVNISRSVVWESMLVGNCSTTDGKKLTWKANEVDWRSGTLGAGGGSVPITETSLVTGDGSYTRWFRCLAKGVKGDSANWAYSYHTFAAPLQAKITDVTWTRSGSTYIVTVKWNAPSSNARPIDSVKLEYIIAKPLAGRTAPATGWQTAATLMDNRKKTDGTTVDIPGTLQLDEALFVRVNTCHDNRTTYGREQIVTNALLETPTDLSVSIDSDTNRATITCTNNSEVPDAFLIISYKTQRDNFIVAVSTAGRGQKTISNVQLPSGIAGQDITFVAEAIVGIYEHTTSSGVPSYSVMTYMYSATISYGTSVPACPTNVVLQPTLTPGTAKISWTKTWASANCAELTWADHSDAWESTDEPSSYTITKPNATSWNISNLETGIEWFARVRLGRTVDGETTWSQESVIVSTKLASAPVIPVLQLSDDVITARGTVDASWVYVTSDGTGQGSATLAEVITSGGLTTYRTIASTTTAQTITVSALAQGWLTGTTHNLVVRVTSGSGKLSDDWSAPVPVIVADAMTCTITQHSLETVTEIIEEEEITYKALTELPLTLTVTGAKAGGQTQVVIERAAEYHVDRPDESTDHGYDNETIAVYSQYGEAAISIGMEDLIGSLDEGADYRIIATTQDSFGQTATATQDFRVKWEEAAIMPEATVITDDENLITRITPVAPDGASETATCDIYRLSVDKPVLIYQGAQFGTEYVDPYPTIGEYGGHRLVYRTETDNYITDENKFAWLDLGEADGDTLELAYNVIEWESGQVKLTYNVDVTNSWSKDFAETKYLGGSVRGDWNAGVSRSGSLHGVAVSSSDQDLIQAMRRLAAHPGICHVRTKEGSSFSADVQVSEKYNQGTAHKIVEFDLKITRVDTEALDGLTYEDWLKTHPQQEGE